jgi:hypothetical protein
MQTNQNENISKREVNLTKKEQMNEKNNEFEDVN